MAMGFGSVGRRLDEQCDDDTVLAADPQQTVEDGGDGVDEDSGATIRPSQGRRRRHKTAPAPKTRASPSEPVSGSPEGESSGGGSGAVGRGGPALEVPSSLTSSYPLLGHLVSPRANPEHPTAPSSTATTPRIDRPPPYTRVSPTSAAGSTLLPGGGVPMDEPPPYPSDSTTLGPRPLRYPLTQRPPPSTVPATDPPAYTAFASPTATAASPVAPSASSRSLRQPSLSSAHPLPGMPRSSLSSLGTSSAASPSPSSAFPTTATVRRRATSDSDSAASPAAAAGPSDQSAAEGGPTCKPGLLQPRLAVVLGLPPQWHPVLFGGRLLSLVPALWWGVPAVLRVAVEAYLLAWVALLEGWGGQKGAPGAGTADGGSGSNGAEARRLVPALLDGGAGRQAVFGGSVADDGFAAWTAYVNLLRQMGDLDPALVLTDGFDRRRFLTARGLRVLASGLGVVWCGAAAYLSYFLTDSLMSRWLLNYTPIATVVRLTAIALVNMYLTGVTVTLFVAVLGKGAADFHLAAWLAISAGLTVAHRVTLRRIDIRKDTSASFAVVSVASFISAVVLTIEVLIYSTMLVGPSTGGREESVFMG